MYCPKNLIFTERVPSCHDNTPIIRCIPYFPNALFQLIQALISVIAMHVFIFSAKVAPLKAVNRAQVTFFSLREAVLVKEFS